MNAYERAMERCAPPAELETRLRDRVLAAEPAARPRVIRPRSFAQRALLAAAIAAVLTVSAGAVVLAVEWDAIFERQFGREAASTPTAESLFQKVGVTANCGDVMLTVSEALGDDKTIYVILDYRLPETADRAAVQAAIGSSEDSVGLPDVGYYATGDVTWEDLHRAEADRWSATDWSNWKEYAPYIGWENALYPHCFTGGSSKSTVTQNYDRDTGTLTYLLRFTTESTSQHLTGQPLTLLVLPPVLTVNGVDTALADHPALVTFQPEYSARAKSGQVRPEGILTASVTISPLAITGMYRGSDYTEIGELLRDTTLVYLDGTQRPVRELVMGYGGGKSDYRVDGKQIYALQYSTAFQDLLDITQVRAVRVGDLEIPIAEK